MARNCGVLMPVSSLPGPYGIGSFSENAYRFVRWLKTAGIRLWQILPLCPTGFGDSPYQSFSSFAGNHYFIDLDALKKEGFIKKKELCSLAPETEAYIDYGRLFNERAALLKAAFKRADTENDPCFTDFCKKNSFWLSDYCLFMSLKEANGGLSWDKWDAPLKLRKRSALTRAKSELKDSVSFHAFVQYKFNAQWLALKNYANGLGIKIIGDLPIYAAYDSADVWANPKLFELDANLAPACIAGCPPDPFTPLGQLWGNPLYDWDYHKNTKYRWWKLRIKRCFELYDILRIDHFRGFESYYSIPANDPDASRGVWRQGPGIGFFASLKRQTGKNKVIAEDLGFLTPAVKKLVEDSGYPGMRVLQFAFDGDPENIYLPHKYPENCVAYTGTHDNDTIAGWMQNAERWQVEAAGRYIGASGKEDFTEKFIMAVLKSRAETAVIPIQDFLGKGSCARINTPATLGGINWRWRMESAELTKELARKIKEMLKESGRL